MRTIDLNGKWTLTGKGNVAVGPIAAEVPGNIEIDLENAGIVPDLFFGCNEKLLRPFEFNDWNYIREFVFPSDFSRQTELIFEGIDCIAEIFVNGQKAGEAANAFIRHPFKTDGLLKPGEKNTVEVRIHSPVLAAREVELEHRSFACWRNFESLPVRKPRHQYGWDIMPRMLLGGLYRAVRLEERPEHFMRSCYFDLRRQSTNRSASVFFSYSFATSLPSWDTFRIELDGTCGNASFHHAFDSWFNSGSAIFEVPEPKLWYPYGYGEPNLYDVAIHVSTNGKELFMVKKRIGFRTVVLEYGEDPAQFRFVVNGIPIMVKGSNWVPADALHSRDRFRSASILKMASELRCNMLRVWGGSIYETSEFYEYCDSHGIMVWQDFMSACESLPQTEDFLARFRKEVEFMTKELRQHPSIVLWAGDNEVDASTLWHDIGMKPGQNRLTREVIPQVLARLDPNRPYLPGSPYCSAAAETANKSPDQFPEQHAWGPRDYFKSPYYAAGSAVFISETGYHGAPAADSIRKFIPPEKLWPPFDNPEWITHATEGYAYRIRLMFDQIDELFHCTPEDLETFVEASQISQAEADKFFIENTRFKRWKRTGILWWNLMDGWPQFSDAVADYYFVKKLAFDYIRISQQFLLGIAGEWMDWGHELVMANDTLTSYTGTLVVTDAETDEELFRRSFEVAPNSNTVVGKLRLPNCERRMLILRWTTDQGVCGANHYMTGRPPVDFQWYRQFIPELRSLA